MALAACFGSHALLSLCRPGRTILSELQHLFNKFLLAFVLLLLSLLYMPITRQLLTVLICEEKRCVAGEWYPKQAHSWESAFLADASFQERLRGDCEPCRFYNYGGAPSLDGAPYSLNATCPAFDGPTT